MDELKHVARPPEPRAVKPLDRPEYLERRKVWEERYRESIGRYDQLVPWGAGGALLASVTFLEKIAPHPQAFTRWMLFASWATMLLALAASTASHYTSSRLFSCRVRLLDHRQKSEHAPDEAEWRREWEQLNRRVRWWGRVTAILNPLAGLALVAGAALLAAFAFYNAPFTSER